MKYVITDTLNNIQFDGMTFDSFDEADEYLMNHFEFLPTDKEYWEAVDEYEVKTVWKQSNIACCLHKW